MLAIMPRFMSTRRLEYVTAEHVTGSNSNESVRVLASRCSVRRMLTVFAAALVVVVFEVSTRPRSRRVVMVDLTGLAKRRRR